MKKITDRISPTQIIMIGFLALILIGALLLSLPVSAASGEATGFTDALFTATSAVCVTGLLTLPAVSHWSLFGQVILLILIQIGGLGIIAIIFTIFVTFRKRIGMRERILIHEAYALDTFQGLGKAILKIFKGALTVEMIGAVLYSFQFIPEFGVSRGIWYSVFHAVSAFCNAGIDLVSSSSFCGYADNLIMNFTTMFLIVTGGIGFCVWWDIIRVVKNAIKIKRVRGQLFHRLTLHSKLAITITAILIFGGTFLLLLLEWNNEATIGNMPVGRKIMASMFQAITDRTAGFATIPQENFTDAGMIVNLILMFVGGSPAGTAGGVKTTTIAMIVLTVVSVIKGRKDTEIFNRRVSAENIRTGLTVISISLIVLISGIMILSVIENAPLSDIIYEATSALATVGLSRNFTGDLQIASRFVIIVLMFIGRIGPITMAFALRFRNSDKTAVRKLAESNIIVG